ncbi:MAG: orotidine-5'-phosphate decarboxylase [Treponema sp.]|nr:orotidine-5'-phosphate decarboxylase [Treponema sp.]
MLNIDRLYENVAQKGHVCVGLDTCIDYVPDAERQKYANDAQAVLAFNKALIDETHDVCACFKVQIAYYEEMGVQGLVTYAKTLEHIRSKGALAIADIKRGDIADTALRYAKAHFTGEFAADFVTLTPYLGLDSLDPWLKEAKAHDKGAFVLMRTSNPGYKDFQSLNVDNRCLYNVVGERMSALAQQYMGKNGYGMFGVVVGCTETDEAARIRAENPGLFFLIPGYGAQGGSAQNAALLLRDNNGGVVNASRSIITAWRNEEKDADNIIAAKAARCATIRMRDEILEALRK